MIRPTRLTAVLVPLLLAGHAGRIAAQTRPRPRVTSTLALNPLTLPFGLASAEYERALGRSGFSLGAGGLTTFGGGAGNALEDGEAYRTLQLKFKYYPREDGLRGFAVGLTGGVAHARSVSYRYAAYDGGSLQQFGTSYRSRTAPTVGATLDYNFLIGRQRRFLIGLGAGAKRALGSSRGVDPLGDVLPDGRLQIGYGF